MPETMHRSVRTRAVKFADDDADLRQIKARFTDETRDWMEDIVEAEGARLDAFRKNPIILFNHDSSKPVARCVSVVKYPGFIEGVIQFPRAGVSELSDETLGLIRDGVLNGVSIGFLVHKMEPIKGGGWRYTDRTLLECSIVSTPANHNALITQRAFGGFDPEREAAVRQLEATLSRVKAGWASPRRASSLAVPSKFEPDELVRLGAEAAANPYDAVGRRHYAQKLREHLGEVRRQQGLVRMPVTTW